MKLASTLPVPDDQLESDSFMMYGLKVKIFIFKFVRTACPAYFLLSVLVQDEALTPSSNLLIDVTSLSSYMKNRDEADGVANASCNIFREGPCVDSADYHLHPTRLSRLAPMPLRPS